MGETKESSQDQAGDRSCQQKVEAATFKVFGGWGRMVANNPCKVFWLSMLFLILLASGMGKPNKYEDEQKVWTPTGSQSVTNEERAKEMFPSTTGFISVMAEVKDADTANPSNILTKAAFEELNGFRTAILEHEVVVNNKTGAVMKMQDVCMKILDKCQFVQDPLLFVTVIQQDWSTEIDFDEFSDDDDLREQINTGTGGYFTGNGEIIVVDTMFGGTEPEIVTQDDETGENDLESAEVMMMATMYEKGDYAKEELRVFETSFSTLAQDYNAQTTSINVYILTAGGVAEAFGTDVQGDLNLVGVAVGLVAVYCIIFMGSCSPIHMRSAAAGITLLCVGLSYAASTGLAYYAGGQTAGIHQLLPFLLIGIGVDDMFVIASALDQTNPRDTVPERMRMGMIHAGASITITSFTNAIAFFLGCTSSLEALRSFCMFAGLGILFLYFSSITVFSAFMVWDLKRQAAGKGDCCGACCCGEDFCCGGACLTPKQKAYPYRGKETDAIPEELYANGTQRFLHQKFSKVVTSKYGIMLVLGVWLIYIAVSIFGITNVNVDFKVSYFIGEDAYVRSYFDRNEKYFDSGETVTIYVDAPTLEYHTKENQQQLDEFNEKIQECPGCQKQWVVPKSLKSWYTGFKAYAQENALSDDEDCWDSEDEIVEPDLYYECLDAFLASDRGRREASNILTTESSDGAVTGMTGFRQTIQLIYIESSATDGVQVLSDLRALEGQYGLDGTFSFEQRYFDFECYVVFEDEAILNVALALVAVFTVLLLITANLGVAALILLQVILVDVFLFGLLYLWDVDLNTITVVNLVVAIGLAVDYTAHIGHAYLTVDSPETDPDGKPLTNHEKRVFKARGAVGAMGPSVFHGAASTFLAIVVLSPSKSYIFINFFRMWFGIIVFGVCNGFILLPVLLALCGPLNKVEHPEQAEAAKAPVRGNQVSDDEKEQKVAADLQEVIVEEKGAANAIN